MDRRFTDEELRMAKGVDLCQVAEALGYTVRRIGKYHTLKEMDSIRIYNRTNWFRWSLALDEEHHERFFSSTQRETFPSLPIP